MARLFGTDGARGVANTELTCQTAFLLGQAAVAQLGKTIVLGKDTRLSGDMLEASVVAGITSMGGTALLAGSFASNPHSKAACCIISWKSDFAFSVP